MYTQELFVPVVGQKIEFPDVARRLRWKIWRARAIAVDLIRPFLTRGDQQFRIKFNAVVCRYSFKGIGQKCRQQDLPRLLGYRPIL